MNPFRRLSLLTLALVLTGASGMLHAQSAKGSADDQDRLMERVYLKLASILATGRNDNTTLLALAHTGIPVAPGLDPEVNQADANYLNTLFDPMLIQQAQSQFEERAKLERRTSSIVPLK